MPEQFPYLVFEYKPNQIFAPKDILSFPFPTNLIPEPLYSVDFFVECVGSARYLRHTRLSHFCMPIEPKTIDVELPYLDENSNTVVDRQTGEVHLRKTLLCYFVAHFQGIERCVGFIFENKSRYFLHLHSTDLKFSELTSELKSLYESAALHWSGILKTNDQRVTDFRSSERLKSLRVRPLGPWEEKLFAVHFKSNPDLLSDDEFEMIFGQSR